MATAQDQQPQVEYDAQGNKVPPTSRSAPSVSGIEYDAQGKPVYGSGPGTGTQAITPGPNTGYVSGLGESFPSTLKDYATQVVGGPLAPHIPSQDEASQMFQKEGWGALLHAIPGYDAASDLVKNFPERFSRGYNEGNGLYGSNIVKGAAEGLAPLVGINPENVRARAAKGDTAGIAGELTVPTAMAAAAAEPLVREPVRSMLSPYREAAGVRDIGEGLGVPTSKSALAITGMDIPKEVKTGQDLNSVRSDLAQVARQFPTKGTGSEATFYNAKNIREYANQLWDQAHQQPIQAEFNTPVVQADIDRMMQAGIGAITPEALDAEALAKNTTPAEIKQKLVDSLQNTVGRSGRTLGSLDTLIRDLNADVATPRAQQAYGPLDMRMRQAVLKEARGVVDDTLTRRGQPGVKENNQRWGALDNVVDQMVQKGVAEAKAEGKEGLIPDWAHAYVFQHVGGVPSVGLGVRPSQALKQTPSSKISSGMKRLGKTTLEAKPFTSGRPAGPPTTNMALPGSPNQPPAPGPRATPPPPSGPVPQTGPGTNVASFPENLSGWPSTPANPAGAVPNWPPKVADFDWNQPAGPPIPDATATPGSLSPGGVYRPPGGAYPIRSASGGPPHPPTEQGGASVPSGVTPPPTDLSVAPKQTPDATVLPEQIQSDFVDESVHPWQSDARIDKKADAIQQGEPAVIVARENPNGTVSPVKGHQTPIAAQRTGSPVQVVNAGPVTDGEKAAMTAESHFFPQDDRPVRADMGKDAESERDSLPEEVKNESALPPREGPQPDVVQRGNSLPEQLGERRDVQNRAIGDAVIDQLYGELRKAQANGDPEAIARVQRNISDLQEQRSPMPPTTIDNFGSNLTRVLADVQRTLNDPSAPPEMKRGAYGKLQALKQLANQLRGKL